MTSPNHPIGRVVATERDPTTTSEVRFWLAPDVGLKPFDFVRLRGRDEGAGEFYAIIHEIKHVSDESSPLSSFISSDFGRSEIEPRVSRVVATYAEAAVLFNSADVEMPIPHGFGVYWPEPDGVRLALGIDDYKRPTPAGFITMSGPGQQQITIQVEMDADYLIGPEGAHMNVSGISGLATKTSYAMFLLSGIQQNQEAKWTGSEDSRAAFVILNVKGADLLHVHERASDLGQGSTRADWNKCGLEARPLKNVTYFYPCAFSEGTAQTKLDQNAVTANVQNEQAFFYYYDVDNVLDRLALLFEDMDDPAQTLVSCSAWCRDEIPRRSSWRSFRNSVEGWTKKGSAPGNIQVGSWRRFFRLFSTRTRNPLFTEEDTDAAAKKEVPLSEMLNHLQPGNVVVIDIAQLPDFLQNFVVGDVIQMLRDAKSGDTGPEEDEEEGRLSLPPTQPIILFADELNKFAPKSGQARSLTRHLREVSERGRSEGVILFGAEQFRSGVDPRVTGNSGTLVFGKTTAVESRRDPEIKELPGNQAKRVPFLRKGELLVSHTRFSCGTLKLRFPRNAYQPG